MKSKTIEELLELEAYIPTTTEKLQTSLVTLYYAVRNFFKYNVILRIRHGFDVRDVWDLDDAYITHIMSLLDKYSILLHPSCRTTFKKYITGDCIINKPHSKDDIQDVLLITNNLLPEHQGFRKELINWLVPRLTYLSENFTGHPTFTKSFLAEIELEDLYDENDPVKTWKSILNTITENLLSTNKYNQLLSFNQIRHFIYYLWD
jgi:hypothetical protein